MVEVQIIKNILRKNYCHEKGLRGEEDLKIKGKQLNNQHHPNKTNYFCLTEQI